MLLPEESNVEAPLEVRDSRFQNILQVPLPHDRVVRPPNLGDTNFSRFRWARVVADEPERLLVLEHDSAGWRRRTIPLGILPPEARRG